MPDNADTVLPQPDVLDTAAAGPTAIRGSLMRVTGYVAGMIMSVASVSLLIRHLGVVDFGRYVTVLSLVTIVQGVTDAGLVQVGIREYAMRTGVDRDRLMGNLVGVRIVLTAMGVAIATAFAAVAGYGSTLVVGTLLGGAGLILTVVQGTFAVPLASELRLGWVTLMEVLRQVLTVVGIIALVVAGARLLSFLAVPVPVGVVVLVVTGLVVRGSIPLRPSFHRSEWAQLIRSVLPFAAAVAIGTLYLRITVIIMSLVATKTQTGYYATSYRVLEVLIAIPPMVVGSALPVLARAARDDRERLAYILRRLFEATLIVGVGVGLVLLLGAQFAIRVLAGSKSNPSVLVLQLQSLAIVATFVASTWQYGLLSLYRHRALLVVSAAALVLSVGLALALVPSLQARGAAISFTSGEVAVAVMSYILLRRLHGPPQVGSRVAVRVAVAAAIALTPLAIPGMASVLRALIGGALYLGVLVLLHAFPQEFVDALRRRTAAAQ